MGWLSGYAYRKKCTVIATAAGAQTNYQLELKVGESSGASGEDVDCENNCQNFPDDIRFTEEDGETTHDYWIEKIEGITPNRKVTVIIEVASIPASGSVDFYIYYGKSGDSGESSGANTFVFFTGNPTSLGFTETQALNVSGKGWQGVASDGTNLYLFAKDSDNNIIYKFNKSGTQLDVNSSPGFDHMSDGCYHNSKLYVADMDTWYSGQPHSEAKGTVRLYNVTSGLPYANEEHAVGDHWAEAVVYYDGYWWIVFHCCSIIRKYNSSWNFIKEYDIVGHGGTEASWADANGYQGIDFFQYGDKTYAGLTVHHSVTGGPEFYYFEYDSEADDFTLIDHFDPPNEAANQGWCCDDPLNISDVWFADRAYAQPPNARIRQHAGSFGEKATGNWEEWTDRTGASLEIVDTPQKRSSSKAFKLTQDSSSIHGWWRDKFGQAQTGKFWIEFDARFSANNKKHVIASSEEMLSWVAAKQGPYVVMNRDGTHEGWISVYESAYNDIQTFSINQWYKFGELIDITADTWDLWIDGVEKDTALTFAYGNALSNIRQINVGGYLEYPAGYYYVQDVRVRKHASPEPTWGAWYEEETPYLMLKLLQDKELNIELSQKTLKEADLVVGDVILDSMDTTTGWSTDGAMSNITVNVTEKKEGTGALNLIKALTSTYNAGILKAISSVNLESTDVRVWLFLKDAAAKNKISAVEVNLADSAQNGAEWHFSASSLSVGWNLLTVDTSSTPDYSDPSVDLTDITEIQLYVNTNQATDTYAEGDVIADYYHYWESEILLLKLLQG